MKKILSNTNILIFIITNTFLLILEILFRLYTTNPFWNIGVFRIMIETTLLSVFISFISYLLKKHKYLFLTFSFILIDIYVFSQISIKDFLGNYFSFQSIISLNNVKTHIPLFLSTYIPKYGLFFLPLLLIILLYKIPYKNYLIQWQKITIYLGTLLSLIILFQISLKLPFMQDKYQIISNQKLFKYNNNSNLSVNQFGILGYSFIEFKNLFLKNNINITTIDNYFNNLNDNTKPNAYTGLFKDKNLIVIMLESVNDIIINPEYFPNFYQIYTNGWQFINNYSPRSICSTIGSEFGGMTGIYPLSNVCLSPNYENNTYYTSLFNLFNEAGYYTLSMHDYTDIYYHRAILHKNLGSQKYYSIDDLGIPYSEVIYEWPNDEEFITKAMDITLKGEQKFMLWLTTVSTHQPYIMASTLGNKYLSLFAETNYTKDLKRYLSKLKTVDNALGILLDRLKEANILDDTIIAIYSDHYPYELPDKYLQEIISYDLSDYEKDRTPFVIYNPNLKPQKIDKYTSYINLTPTLANLFNLDYKANLYLGKDIFSDNYENILIFNDGSWKNQDLFYNSNTNSIKYLSNNVYTDAEIKTINSYVSEKLNISKLIIENNYFKNP